MLKQLDKDDSVASVANNLNLVKSMIVTKTEKPVIILSSNNELKQHFTNFFSQKTGIILTCLSSFPLTSDGLNFF